MWVKFENCLKMEVWEFVEDLGGIWAGGSFWRIWEGFGQELGKSFLHIYPYLGGIWAGIGKISKEDLGNLKKNIDQSQV